MVVSSEERALQLPGLELMFRAAAHVLEKRLQDYAASKSPVRGDGTQWLTVATGPCGSYREEHVLTFLERHLEPMWEGRQWRIMLMDAYKAQMTDNVRRLCWSRGYVVVIHGGGATAITQPNDTDLHQHLRRSYVEKETAVAVKHARLDPKATHYGRPEDCIDCMLDVWRDPGLHVQAAKGFKSCGITNKLDGTEDHLICREAGVFWKALAVARKRTDAVEDVAMEVEAGRLGWLYDDVYSVVLPFPEKGQLDVLHEFQDEEMAALEEGEKPWAEGRGDGVDSDSSDDDEEKRPKARGNEDDAASDHAGASHGEDGHGDGSEPASEHEGDGHGDGKASSHVDKRVGGQLPPLTAEEADVFIRARERMAALALAMEAIREHNMPDVSTTLAKALHAEERLACGRRQENAKVAKALQENRVEEERVLQAERQALREKMAAAAATAAAAVAAKAANEQLAKARAKLKAAEQLKALGNSVRTFTLEMLGQGDAKGGAAMPKRNRQELLGLLAQDAAFSQQDAADWSWFRQQWDRRMAELHDRNWGSEFAGIVQGLLLRIESGEDAAAVLVAFMKSEMGRVLRHVQVVRVQAGAKR